MISKILNLFSAPKPAQTPTLHPFAQLPRAHFTNAVSRAIRANGLDVAHAKLASTASADLWALHVARDPGFESARVVEQIAVDYVANLARFQAHDERVTPMPSKWAALLRWFGKREVSP